MSVVRVAIIGYGSWGTRLVGKFMAEPRTEVVAIADHSAPHRRAAAEHHRHIPLFGELDEVLAEPSVDAVVIATPIATHANLALRALRADKHVLVEKPLACGVAEAEELVELARRQRRVLVVDHTLVHAAAARAIRELIASGELGRIRYYDSIRSQLARPQRDSSVIWDLAAHDFSVMDLVLAQTVGAAPRWVSTVGAAQDNLAYIATGFDDGVIGHVHVSWTAPTRTRRTIIGGTAKLLVWDELAEVDPVKLYDSASGDPIASPSIDGPDALTTLARAFAAACLDDARTASDGEAGVRVVKMLAAAQASLEQQGARIALC